VVAINCASKMPGAKKLMPNSAKDEGPPGRAKKPCSNKDWRLLL
jgi:hypothetical protein